MRKWVAPLLLLAACLLAYGLTIPWLGLYADDWPFVYVNHLAGLRGVVDFISWVRPVAAWVFASAAALVGTNFWQYHTLLMLLHWVDALLLWQVLRQAWPERPMPALWAALLFAVYPAFKQHPLALEYIPHFICLALLFGSLWITLRQAQQPFERQGVNRLLSGLAWLGAAQVFILEYFVGLELLRPVLTYLVLSRKMSRRDAAQKAFRLWLPYLFLLLLFVFWRVGVVGFPSYQPELINGLSASPLRSLIDLAKTILHDLWTAGIMAWAQPFTSLPAGGRTILAWGAVVGTALVAMAGGLVLYIRFMERSSSGQISAVHLERSGLTTPVHNLASGGAWPLEYILVGLFAMAASGWPFWVTHIPLSLDFPWDRTSLAFMLGSCLLASGLLGLLTCLPGWFHRRSFRWPAFLVPSLILSVFLAFSIGLHFQNGNAYRKEWSIFTPFYWQLTWRMPGLAPGTALILDQSPFNYHVDKFLSPLVNWTYAPDSRSLQTPYALLDFYKQWKKTLPPKTTADPIQTQYGTLVFNGDTGRVLLLVYAPPACLRVLTPNEEKQLLLSAEMKESLKLTNLDQIELSPQVAAHPPAFLGPEPTHDWCYYFEKADLALQSGDFQTIAALGDQALEAGLSAHQPSENLVFARAYANLNRWDDARRLTDAVIESGDFYHQSACVAWQQIVKAAGTTEAKAKAQETLSGLSCR